MGLPGACGAGISVAGGCAFPFDASSLLRRRLFTHPLTHNFMASSVRRGSVGLDGAESQYCDLSGRGLTSGQVDRTLRVFSTADTIDLSNNDIDKVPSSIPAES